jgi:DNA-directed RNA polymerase subunit RPC12/RpoP
MLVSCVRRRLKMETYKFIYKCSKCGSLTEMKYVVSENKSWIPLSCKECEAHILSILKFPKKRGSPAAFRVRDEVQDCLLFPGELAYEDAFLGWIRDHQGEKCEE